MEFKKAAVQVHTVTNVPNRFQGVFVSVSVKGVEKRLPICHRRSITGGFFWENPLIFDFDKNAEVLFVLYGVISSNADHHFIANTSVPLAQVYEFKRYAIESKSFNLTQGMTIMVSIEGHPRPKGLFDEATSFIQPPSFLNSASSRKPLFLSEESNNLVASLWSDLAKGEKEEEGEEKEIKNKQEEGKGQGYNKVTDFDKEKERNFQTHNLKPPVPYAAHPPKCQYGMSYSAPVAFGVYHPPQPLPISPRSVPKQKSSSAAKGQPWRAPQYGPMRR